MTQNSVVTPFPDRAGPATMRARKLDVEGCVEFTPTVFPDDRGLFVAPFQQEGFVEAVGHRLFPVAQSNIGKSRRGVLRGLHFTRTPPGSAKYVHCPRGSLLDIVADIRLGSRTYGRWDAVVLGEDDYRALYIPVGVGHAFVALEDDTLITYLTSAPYVPEDEVGLFAFDPALGLPIPAEHEIRLSKRDRLAPTLAEARELGILPLYEDCVAIERELFGGDTRRAGGAGR